MAPLSLGHTKIEGTMRYLGIEVDDVLAIGEQVGVNDQGRADMLCPSAISRFRPTGEFETREPPNEPVFNERALGMLPFADNRGQPDS
ncbi:hypothetical protein ABIF86_005646 [Bradyrhizobium japonicum]